MCIEFGNRQRGTPKKYIEVLLELYTALLRSEDDRWPNFTEEERFEFDRNVISNLVGYIKLDPFMKRVKEVIVTLHDGDVEKANEMLQAILDEKDAIASEMQSANRKGKSKCTKYKKLLTEIVQINIDISENELLKILKTKIGYGVIRDIDYRSNTIVTVSGAEYTISGLKDYLYKLRRSLI
jgi:hypothetical protein